MLPPCVQGLLLHIKVHLYGAVMRAARPLDTKGLPSYIQVHAANGQDRAGAKLLFDRLSKDYEYLPESSEARCYLTMIDLMSKRLAAAQASAA